VMVYIHGGSYLTGQGSGNNASSLCAGIVYVSFNYRLGLFGALALPELLNESSTTGNYALQDQREALAWVQRNIAQFGGDPSRVTISGESAGAMSVAAHMALPRSQGLFQQGVMMSGNDFSTSLAAAGATGQHFAARVGCGQDVLACLRGRDALELLNVQTAVYNQSMRALQVPVADGFELPIGGSLSERFTKGLVNGNALIAGFNRDDISLFLAGNQPMQNVLKAVVRDHRLPSDYNYCYVQPMHTRSFMKNLKRFFATRQMTKQNITIPLFMMFVAMPVYCAAHLWWSQKVTGTLPGFVQG